LRLPGRRQKMLARFRAPEQRILVNFFQMFSW
jgi:hypothetical protein